MSKLQEAFKWMEEDKSIYGIEIDMIFQKHTVIVYSGFSSAWHQPIYTPEYGELDDMLWDAIEWIKEKY